MSFIRNLWYVAAWSHELGADLPIGRQIIGEPIVLYRKTDGHAVALEDRCPHRRAPLSLGRIERDDLRCMYHGLKFGPDGRCKAIPGADALPPNVDARVFPLVERASWIWLWMGDPALADPASIPDAPGLDDPEWVLRADALDYAADYQLINDNLFDLSHLDFVHETTLGLETGSTWSEDAPRVTTLDNGLLFERWFFDHPLSPGSDLRADTWNRYRFLLPGLFLMETQAYPTGTAVSSGFERPDAAPMLRRVEQQAVTPTAPDRSRYLYASGFEARISTPEFLDGAFAVVRAAFAEDKRMIEAQQRIWDNTPPDRQMAFIPQDKAPAMFRRLVKSRLAAEMRSMSEATPRR